MIYKKVNPPDTLTPFVECFYWLEDDLTNELPIQSPPNGYTALVVNIADPYKAFQGEQEALEVPRVFISGQFTSNYHIVLKGEVRIAGLVLKPTAFHHLFDLKMSTLVNNRIPLSYVDPRMAESLLADVRAAEDINSKATLLFNSVIQRLGHTDYHPNGADQAVNIIDQHKGNISVNEVAEELKISQRSLEKWFLQRVGISPKLYARIKRFAVLSNIVAHKEKIDWQEILCEAGFHDQSHLIKEFLDFNRMNPADYHKRHQEAIRFVKKN